METIQHQPKAITPCIRPKAAQSKEIETPVDEFLKRPYCLVCNRLGTGRVDVELEVFLFCDKVRRIYV